MSEANQPSFLEYSDPLKRRDPDDSPTPPSKKSRIKSESDHGSLPPASEGQPMLESAIYYQRQPLMGHSMQHSSACASAQEQSECNTTDKSTNHDSGQRSNGFRVPSPGIDDSDAPEANNDRCINRIPTPESEQHDTQAQEDALADDIQHHESDTMLAQAYREVAEASKDIAIWADLTATALAEKLAAARREFEAASQVVAAKERYEQAIERISQAAAHRQRRTSTS